MYDDLILDYFSTCATSQFDVTVVVTFNVNLQLLENFKFLPWLY